MSARLGSNLLAERPINRLVTGHGVALGKDVLKSRLAQFVGQGVEQRVGAAPGVQALARPSAARKAAERALPLRQHGGELRSQWLRHAVRCQRGSRWQCRQRRELHIPRRYRSADRAADAISSANADGWTTGVLTVTWNWSDDATGSGLDPANWPPTTQADGYGDYVGAGAGEHYAEFRHQPDLGGGLGQHDLARRYRHRIGWESRGQAQRDDLRRPDAHVRRTDAGLQSAQPRNAAHKRSGTAVRLISCSHPPPILVKDWFQSFRFVVTSRVDGALFPYRSGYQFAERFSDHLEGSRHPMSAEITLTRSDCSAACPVQPRGQS